MPHLDKPVSLYLLRHGKTGQAWQPDQDPDLNAQGQQQAQACAQWLSHQLPVMSVLSSPWCRTKETAAPLLACWQQAALSVAPAWGEIPFPSDETCAPGVWLERVLQGKWCALPPIIQHWRQAMHAYTLSCTQDQVIFTHFLNICSVVSLFTRQDAVLSAQPGNGEGVIVQRGAAGHVTVHALSMPAITEGART